MHAVVVLVRVRPREWVRGHGGRAVRLLLPTPAFLRLDALLAVTALLAALWLLPAAIVFGADGIFTEDWMGCPGMTDPAGRGYQAAVVGALPTTAWWTFWISGRPGPRYRAFSRKATECPCDVARSRM